MVKAEALEKLPFPIEALGSTREIVMRLRDQTQSPMEICFASAFMVLNHAAQALVNVEMPHHQKVIPVSCFFITVAESSERKTSCESIMLRMTQEYVKQLLNQYKIDEQNYKATTLSKKNKQLDGLITSTPPCYPLLMTSDPTMQGLQKILIEGFPSVIFSTSEGGQFFGGYAMRKDNQLHTISFLSSLWDGRDIDIVRKGSNPLLVQNRRLALHISVQPDVFTSTFQQKNLTGQGLFSRCLVSQPKPKAGSRIIVDAKPFSSVETQRVLNLYLQAKTNEEGLVFKTMVVHPDALPLLDSFYYYGESNINRSGVLYTIRDFVGKSVEHVLRIAATLTVYEDSATNTIPPHLIESAIAIVRFYMSQQFHLFNEPTQSKQADKLLSWIQQNYKNDEIIDKRTLLQYSPSSLRNKTILDPLILSLEGSGFLKRITNKTWKINTSSSTTIN